MGEIMEDNTNYKKKDEDFPLSKKMIVYTLNTDNAFYVIIDFEELRNVAHETEKLSYIDDHGNKKETYLGYLLIEFFKGMDDERFKQFKITTYEKDSNNIINNIIGYETCGELEGTDTSPLKFSRYKRNFELEELRNLYGRVKKCITFKSMNKTVSTDDSTLDIDEVRKLR